MPRRLFHLITCAALAGASVHAATAATAPGRPPASQAPAATPPGAPSEAAQGMVVTGDQEAPLVLYILPWQPARLGEAPAVDAQPLLPRVLDSERSVLDGPLNRPEPAAIRSPR